MKRFILILLIVLTIKMNAQDIIDDWQGKISYQGVELRIVFHIKENDETYQSTMDSPDQNANGVGTDKKTFENGKLTIEANVIRMNYTAELDSSEKILRGTFNQQGVSLPLTMTKGEEKTSLLDKEGMNSDENILGNWNGLLEIVSLVII